MTKEIPPCPLCGSTDLELDISPDKDLGWVETYKAVLYCGDCGVAFHFGNYGMGKYDEEMTRDRVLAKWSRRAPVDERDKR